MPSCAVFCLFGPIHQFSTRALVNTLIYSFSILARGVQRRRAQVMSRPLSYDNETWRANSMSNTVSFEVHK